MTSRLPIAAVLWMFVYLPVPAAAEPAPEGAPPEAPPPAAAPPLIPEPGSAPAVAPPPSSGALLTFKGMELRISGVLFASWQYLLDTPAPGGTKSANAFEINRAYINVEPRLSRNIWLRITPDITRVKDDGSLGGSLALRLKYAYALFDNALPGLSIKAGLQQTAYIEFEESIWRYRVLGPSGFETFTKVSSSDLGVGVMGTVLDRMLSYQVVVGNGEGYAKPEVLGDLHSARYKDLGARLTLSPFASASPALSGIALTAFAQYGITSNPEGPVGSLARVRAQGLLSYQGELFTLAAAFGVTRDDDEAGTINRGQLLTAFGFVNLPLHLRVLGRVDRFDPDPSTEGLATGGTGTVTRSIAGLAYFVIPDVQVIADVQNQDFENPAAIVDPTLGTSFFLHLEARY